MDIVRPFQVTAAVHQALALVIWCISHMLHQQKPEGIFTYDSETPVQ